MTVSASKSQSKSSTPPSSAGPPPTPPAPPPPKGIIQNLANGVATAGSEASKYAKGLIEFFGTGVGDFGNAITNGLEDAAKGIVTTVATTLGDTNAGTQVNGVINNVGNTVKDDFDKVVQVGEDAGATITGAASNALDGVTNVVDKQNHHAGSAYFSAFN